MRQSVGGSRNGTLTQTKAALTGRRATCNKLRKNTAEPRESRDDVLESSIWSEASLGPVLIARSDISRRCGIISGLSVDVFVVALREAG